jgi:hypothetical protein
MKRREEARSECLLKLHADGGHLDTLTDFCERARVDQKLLQRCLAVNDMSQLLAMDLESVRAALGKRKLPGSASGVGGSETTSVAQLQRVRNRYEAMSMQQLTRCCRDSWLDAAGVLKERSRLTAVGRQRCSRERTRPRRNRKRSHPIAYAEGGRCARDKCASSGAEAVDSRSAWGRRQRHRHGAVASDAG